MKIFQNLDCFQSYFYFFSTKYKLPVANLFLCFVSESRKQWVGKNVHFSNQNLTIFAVNAIITPPQTKKKKQLQKLIQKSMTSE